MDIKAAFTELLHSRKFQYALLAIAFAVVIPIFVSEHYVNDVFAMMLIFGVYASSWNLLAYSGQGSLGHAAFLGIGGFASALLAVKSGVPPIFGLLIGGLLSAGIGLLIGLACVRLKAWFLGMVTFGFAIIASIVAIFWVMKSKWGLAFKAIRENEFEARMVGINTWKYKLLAFVISTFFAGLAGGLYAESTLFIQLDIFKIDNSFMPLIMSVIGGLGTVEGPIIGSIVIVSIKEFMPKIYPFLQPLGAIFPGVSNVGPYLMWAGLGFFLILVVIFLPKGITSLLQKTYAYLREDTSKAKKIEET
jgi:branched-chain amino acid transport system permease protein